MPLLAKLIYADGVNAITLVLFRNLMALPLIGILAFRQGRSFSIPKKALPQISLIALAGCCITPLLLLQSYNYIDSGLATIFHFIYPAVVVVISVLFLKQPLQWKILLCVGLCIVGICLCYTPDSPPDWRGSILAITSGIACAIYICLLAGFSHKQIPFFLFTFYVILISSILLLAFCLLTGSLCLPKTPTGWLLCIVFANLITGGAVVLLQLGTFLLGGERSSILSALEPVVSILVGLLFLQERISAEGAIGSVLVILSSILIAVLDLKANKKGVSV